MAHPKDDPLHRVLEFTDTFIQALRRAEMEVEETPAAKAAAENDEKEEDLDSNSDAPGTYTPEASDSDTSPDVMPPWSTSTKLSGSERTDIKTDIHGDTAKVTLEVNITSSAPSTCSNCCPNCSKQPERVLSRVELAIARLQEDYGGCYPISTMVGWIDVLTDDSKAGAFLALQPGALSKSWLSRQVKG